MCGRLDGWSRPGGTDGKEHHDAGDDSHGTEHHPAVDVLMGKPRPEEKGDDQAERRDRLNGHQRALVQSHGLQLPPRRLEQEACQPHRLAQNLDQLVRVPAPARGAERPFLLQDCAQRKRTRGRESEGRAQDAVSLYLRPALEAASSSSILSLLPLTRISPADIRQYAASPVHWTSSAGTRGNRRDRAQEAARSPIATGRTSKGQRPPRRCTWREPPRHAHLADWHL